MSIPALLVCCLSATTLVASRPTCPNFEAILVREAVLITTLSEMERQERLIELMEAKSNVQYLRRMWVKMDTEKVSPDEILNIMTVFECYGQFLWSINPNPTGTEVAERIRAYRVYYSMIGRSLKRAAGSEGVKKIEFQYQNMSFRLERIYRPLITRAG